jgi:16S rRNA G1207 methylase RsmC
MKLTGVGLYTGIASIEKHVLRRVLPLAMFTHRTYMRVLCWCVDLQERRYTKKTGFASSPPTSLRYRVHSFPNIIGFLRVGERCSKNIEAVLERFGKDLDSFQNVLDFGSGCGRALIWFADRSQSARWPGTDIDPDVVSWCRSNLGFAGFGVNEPFPPLGYASEMSEFV